MTKLPIYLAQVLGTPTRDQIREMNPNYTEFKFPQIKAHPWNKVSNVALCLLVKSLFAFCYHIFQCVVSYGVHQTP